MFDCSLRGQYLFSLFIFDMFFEEGIIMGIYGENPPLMKTRKKIVIEEARLLWQKLLNEGWQKTNKKW